MIMATFIIGGMALTGCEDSNATGNPQSAGNDQLESQVGDRPMDSTEKKQVLDSINVLVSKFETLSKKQETTTKKLSELSKEIKDLKESSHIFDYISWIIAAIALLIAVISIIKLNSIKLKAKEHSNRLGGFERKISSLELQTPSSARTKSTNSGITGSEYSSLASRLNNVERQLNKMMQSQTPVQQNIVQSIPVSNVRQYANEPQNGYFGLPTQMSLTEAYFKRFSDIRESDSRFTVSIRNNKAEFRPLEGTQYLNDLKSNDAIKMALDIKGCALSEATQMRVILSGEAQKDGDRWIITKKATIVLS